MLRYLFKWEDQLELDRRDEDFRNLVFAHDLWPPTIGPSLQHFKALFKDELEPEQPDDVEWVVPRSQDEIESVLAEMAGLAPSGEPVEEHRV